MSKALPHQGQQLLALAAAVLLRLGKAVVTLVGVIVLAFLLVRLAPGDPALVLAGDQGAGDAAFVEEIRRSMGLDAPIATQLGHYISAITTGDFGQSYRENRPVFDIIIERVPATLLLTSTAFVLSLIFGIGFGAWAARKPGGAADSLITTISVGFFAMPMFWIGLMLIILFAVKLNWLPSFGMRDPSLSTASFWIKSKDLAAHMVLPVLTLGLYYTAIHARVARAAVLAVKGQDYIRTARAKGLKSWQIWRDHILRNALLPSITLAAMQFGHLIGGSVLVETVFAWPGIGRLAFDALLSRDYNLLLGVLILASLGVILANLLAELAYRAADPRFGARGKA